MSYCGHDIRNFVIMFFAGWKLCSKYCCCLNGLLAGKYNDNKQFNLLIIKLFA